MIGGRYSLDRKIGRGGMGSVWLGRDEVLGRPVAIKRIGVMPGGSSPDLLRAEREARIAASLNHPHVVGIFDFVHEDDEQWLVMEYVEGTTLAELVRDGGPMPPDQLSPILAQTAEALQAAHAAGIVHRDVKPSNILVREDGEVKLSDFGIARAESDASLTQTGLVTGSPAYLAPEVASGQHATPASDVWSLGATAFHALAGHPPYHVGDNVLGALYRIVNEPPPRLESAGPLAPLVESTMVTDPAGRWSMDRVVRFLGGSPVPALQPLAEQVAAAPPPPPGGPSGPVAPLLLAPEPARAPGRRRDRPRRGRTLPVTIGLLVVALVVVLVVLLMQGDPQNVGSGSPGSGGPTASDSPPPSTSSTAGGTKPTAAGMKQFVTDYLETADATPEAAFEDLTPAYQQASGGRSGYLGFWGDVSIIKVDSLSADPSALTVSYTYTYKKSGQSATAESVTLSLDFDPDTGDYLISGA